MLADRQDFGRPARGRSSAGAAGSAGGAADGGGGTPTGEPGAAANGSRYGAGVSATTSPLGTDRSLRLLLAREQRRGQRVVDEAEGRRGVGEANLRLRRRDVDVDRPGLRRQVQKDRGMPVHADRVARSLGDRARERAVLDRPGVHEEVLVAAARKRDRAAGRIARQPQRARPRLEGLELSESRAAEDLQDAGAPVDGRGRIHRLAPVGSQGEGDRRVGQRGLRDHRGHGARLGLRRERGTCGGPASSRRGSRSARRSRAAARPAPSRPCRRTRSAAAGPPGSSRPRSSASASRRRRSKAAPRRETRRCRRGRGRRRSRSSMSRGARARAARPPASCPNRRPGRGSGRRLRRRFRRRCAKRRRRARSPRAP